MEGTSFWGWGVVVEREVIPGGQVERVMGVGLRASTHSPLNRWGAWPEIVRNRWRWYGPYTWSCRGLAYRPGERGATSAASVVIQWCVNRPWYGGGN